jgi:hypothetical protein
VEWVVREGVGAGGRNEPSLVCTYELKKKKKKNIFFTPKGRSTYRLSENDNINVGLTNIALWWEMLTMGEVCMCRDREHTGTYVPSPQFCYEI